MQPDLPRLPECRRAVELKLKLKYIEFAGPLPIPGTDEVFTTLCQTFPDRLKRIPDGETGHRQGPLHWQTQVFEQAGLSHFLKDEALLRGGGLDEVLPEVSIDPALELDTRWALSYEYTQMVIDSSALRYGHYAIASYQAFSKHKIAGTIPPCVKFQVSLPLPRSFVAEWIRPEYRETAEAQYEAAIVRAIEGIQDIIPHQDLAIQIDCRVASPAIGTRAVSPETDETPLLAVCVTRLARHVAADVDLGLHVAPSSGGTLQSTIDVVKALQRPCPRPMAWLHLSLPADTNDEQSLQPLEDLSRGTKTELVLGLVRPRDEEGSRRRILKAAECLGSTDFGIAAAGNLVDLTQDDFEDILRILRLLSTPSR
ncbi:hypothetical protein PRZ48_008706 [Zasmidium cellare]|uniref:Cobalamin-independent methionine synthase MetE C-terminal/archaeal domain-containing protein n=1 Tax=Zasmidium cellare TaxID=395010 RepID=A0ABR0EGC8_ZASCE|nr:hypothetical protein PRZ48_008706 [Zasmidium cellare]